MLPLVAEAERYALDGAHVVLLLAYEAAPAFDPALAVHPAGAWPLAWMGVYGPPVHPGPPPDAPIPLALPAGTPAWRPAIDETRFEADIARILAHIAAGDTYQVNYTFPLAGVFTDDPWAWFQACAAHASVPYDAYVDLGRFVVMSVSPELFLERRGRRVRTRPMKGTSRRGRWLAEDRSLADALLRSEKARAENVMIVDLLRNDLGRVAEIGSVQVHDLCLLERYPTVWQLTSSIHATERDGTTLVDLLRATFPCGSVTGAPKVRTMEIIAALETAPRGLYTGAICLLTPGGDVTASVPIRTVVLDRETDIATFSAGAGITADSVASEEWAECLAKTRVVRPPAVPADAELFETLRLEDGVLCRRTAHVARMLASAELFGWPSDRTVLEAALDDLSRRHDTGLWRARLFLAANGRVRTDASPLVAVGRPSRVALAGAPIDPRDPLLFNKTTRRDVYDRARGSRLDVDDVLLWNPRREITESTVASLVVESEGQRVTPPIACGLLPGIMRAELIHGGEIEERIVSVADLRRASRVWLVNSLRGWIDVVLVDADRH